MITYELHGGPFDGEEVALPDAVLFLVKCDLDHTLSIEKFVDECGDLIDAPMDRVPVHRYVTVSPGKMSYQGSE